MTGNRVAVVGGGISGLVSAYYLTENGSEVVLYESSDEAGGLASGFEISKGLAIERFYHHNFTGDRDFLDLVRELGLEDDFGSRESTVGVYKHKKFYDFNTGLSLLKLSFLPFRSRLLLGFGGIMVAYLPKFMVQSKTATQICSTYFGRKNRDLFWRPLFQGKFGKYSDQVSSEWFQSRLKSRLSSRRSGGECLIYPKGGYGVFVRVLQEKIKDQGGEILLGKKIKNIEKVGSKYMIEGCVFDAVVTTIEPKHVVDIAPFVTEQLLPSIKYIGVINLVLVTKKQLASYYWTNILDESAPYTGIVEHTNLVCSKEYGGRHIVYLSKYLETTDREYKKTDQQIYKKWTDYLKGMVEIKEGDIIKYYVSRYESAQPIVGVGYQVPPNKLAENFYATSMAHIYPDDRGMEQAVAEAKKIAGIIISKS